MTQEKATNVEPPKPNAEEYNRLVSHAKVQSIRLINSRYDLKPAALAPGSREVWDYNVSYQLLDWHCDNEALILSGTWGYTASCTLGRRKFLTVTAKYLVAYRLSAIADEDAGRSFLERVGKFAAYPYFRSTFAVLTQQSGISLHPLPVISEQPRWVTPPAPASEASTRSSGKKTAQKVTGKGPALKRAKKSKSSES